MKQWYYFGLLFVLLIAWGSGFAKEGSEPDSMGKPPVKAQRIVSLSPSNTEILYALGLEERIVGVASYSDYPPQAQNKPQIGPYNAPDVERVMALQPDLAVAAGEIQAPSIHLLRQAGIPVVSVEPQTMQEILTAIRSIAVATGSEAEGETLCKDLAGKLAKVQQLTAGGQTKRVFFEIWQTPLLTIGAKSYLNDLLQQAGGSNVAAARLGDYVSWDLEALYAADPEVYMLLGHKQQSVAGLLQRPEITTLSAVRQGQVYVLNDDLLARFGPRSFDGVLEVACYLHPELMKGVKAKE